MNGLDEVTESPSPPDSEEPLAQMARAIANAPAEVLPSKFWEHYSRSHLATLDDTGYENFKQTIALNYFTWIVNPSDPQLRFLIRTLPIRNTVRSIWQSLIASRHAQLGRFQSLSYDFLSHMLWNYAERMDHSGVLEDLEEPIEGNPPRVYRNGHLISQDLANSFLEYESIMDPHGASAGIDRIIELGAGYGRTAYVFAKLRPGSHYIVADIPPALYIAQRYLGGLFKDRRIFKFREFESYDSVRAEFEESDLAFLLPHQLALLPDGYCDLFINISSLHEMPPEQVNYYLGEMDRLSRQLIYLKQWRVSSNEFDKVVIDESAYPIHARWERLYWRPCAVQTNFFEALLRVDSTR